MDLGFRASGLRLFPLVQPSAQTKARLSRCSLKKRMCVQDYMWFGFMVQRVEGNT